MSGVINKAWICEYQHSTDIAAKYEVSAIDGAYRPIYFACGSHINKAIQDAQRGHVDNRVVVRIFLV